MKSDFSEATQKPAGTTSGSGKYTVTQGDINSLNTPLQLRKLSLYLVTGLGADIHVSKTLFMRFEYNYLIGTSMLGAQNKRAIRALSGTDLNHNIKFNQSQFKIGFGCKL